MSAPSIARSLTVSVEPPERVARVELVAPGRRAPFVVTVAPAPAADGWLVPDPTDPEPTWRPTFAEAIGEAIAQTSYVLEERVIRELAQGDPGAAGSPIVAAADIC